VHVVPPNRPHSPILGHDVPVGFLYQRVLYFHRSGDFGSNHPNSPSNLNHVHKMSKKTKSTVRSHCDTEKKADKLQGRWLSCLDVQGDSIFSIAFTNISLLCLPSPRSSTWPSFTLIQADSSRDFACCSRFVRPIETGRLDQPHVNQCQFMSGNGTVWSVPTQQVDTQWAYGDEERIRTVNKVQIGGGIWKEGWRTGGCGRRVAFRVSGFKKGSKTWHTQLLVVKASSSRSELPRPELQTGCKFKIQKLGVTPDDQGLRSWQNSGQGERERFTSSPTSLCGNTPAT